jgi:hypothetical protein
MTSAINMINTRLTEDQAVALKRKCDAALETVNRLQREDKMTLTEWYNVMEPLVICATYLKFDLDRLPSKA